MRRFQLGRLLLLGVMAAGTAAVAAEEPPRAVELTLGTTVQRDSNLFRLPDGAVPAEVGLPAQARSDTVTVPYAQLRLNAGQAGQHLDLRARLTRDLFDRNRQFNANRGEGSAGWRGQFSRQWALQAQHEREQRVTSFADFRNPERNLLELRTTRAAVAYRPGPDTRLSAFATRYRGSNSVAARAASDYRIRVERFEIGRAFLPGNEISLGASRTDGGFPNREIIGSSPVDNSYGQFDVDLALSWRAGETTSALLRAGRASRKFDTVTERNFSGAIWSTAINWQPSSRVLLRVNLGRDLNAVDDFDRIYAVSQVQRVGFAYALSARLSAAVDLSRQRTDYEGDPRNFLTSLFGQRPARADRGEEQRLTLTWLPRDRWQLSLGFSNVSRRSNQPGLDFETRLTQFGFEYRAF